MAIRPILSALLRNRAGAILVALQIAITLAIIVNAIYLMQQRIEQDRPSNRHRRPEHLLRSGCAGFDEGHDFHAMVREDWPCCAEMPGVIDAAPMQQVPLSGSGNSSRLLLAAGQKGRQLAG